MEPEHIEEVRRLSQEEGLFDHEIATILGFHRTTITRCRERNKIPRPNLKNRKDKVQTCKGCNTTTTIRRHERARMYCHKCHLDAVERIREKKRIRERERLKKKKHSAGMLESGE